MTNVISKITTPNGTQTIGGDQFDGQWIRSSLKVYDGSINASDTKTIDLSEWLPDITNRYEIILQLQANSGTTSGNSITLQLTSQQSGSSYMADFGGVNRSSSYEMVGGMANLVINANNPYFRIANTGNATVTGIIVYVLYYRVLGWNEHDTEQQNQIENVKIPSSTLSPNGIMWGDLVNTNGVLSNFDNHSYFEIINGKQNNNAEYVVKFTVNGQSTTAQSIMQANLFCSIEITANTLDVYVYNWQTTTKTTLFTAINNTTYWIKFTINGTSATYSYSTDGTNYTQVASFSDSTLTTADNNYTLTLGNSSQIDLRDRPFLGTIDLSECYINVNGERYWSGLDYTGIVHFGGDNFDGQWQSHNGTSSITLLSSATINANSNTSVDISSYIPNDGYAYELLIRAIARTSTTSGNNILLRIGIYSSSTNNLIIRGTTRSNAYRQYSGNCVLPITATQRTLYIQNTGNATATAVTVYITAYKRIGKNVTGGNYLTNIKTPDGTVIPFGGKNTNGKWSYKALTALNNITFNDTATTNHDYTVSNYLPTNNEWYEILINTVGSTGTTSGNNVNWTLYCNPTPTATNLQQGAYTNTRTSSAQSLRLNGIIIGRQDSNGNLVVRVRNFTTVKTGGNYIRFKGYRRLGTNE